jgi:Protein of unknown function (DUF3592)
MISRTNFWFVFGGLWFAIGVLFAAIGGAVLRQHSALEERFSREGATAPGIVLSKSIQGASSEEPTFQVEYRFNSPDGKIIEETVKVDGKTWDSLAEGEEVTVYYVRNQPDLHRLSGQDPDQVILGLIFSAVGGLFAFSGALILWRAMARQQLVARLLREGTRSSAEVIAVVPTNFRINREPLWVIRYRYRDRIGKIHEGKTPHMPPEEARQWQVGDLGIVRFARNEPRKSIWIGKE